VSEARNEAISFRQIKAWLAIEQLFVAATPDLSCEQLDELWIVADMIEDDVISISFKCYVDHPAAP
jgi:hypothetical protein